jgi:hypothetical protein
MTLTNNVVDGQIINAAWGNNIRDRSFQRFATTAERDAQWPPATAGAGAMCITLDTYYAWVSNGTIWRRPVGTVLLSTTFQQTEVSNGGGVRDALFGNYTSPVPCSVTVSGAVYVGFAASAVGAQVDLVRLSDSGVAYTVTHLSAPISTYAAAPVAGTWTGAAGTEVGFKIRTNTTVVAQYVNATVNMVVTAT